MSGTTYYQRNKEVILNRTNEYYRNNKEILREKARKNTENCLKKKIRSKESMEETDITICLKKKKTKTKRISKKLS